MSDHPPIVTPLDDPFFQPDWRFRTATRLAADPRTKSPSPMAVNDQTVRTLARQLKVAADGKARPTPERAQHERIMRWAPTGASERVGRLIEALLLTDAPMDALAVDVGCALEDLQAYERLFFNVRDHAGNMGLSPAQRAFFATEGTFKPTTARPDHLMWRRVAVNAGYHALTQVLELGKGSWAEAPKIDLPEVTMAMAKGETLAKMATGGLSTGELARFESNRIRDRLARHMTGELKMKDEGMELAIQLLQLMAPKMIDLDRIRQAQASEAMPDPQQAQDAIGQTEVPDNGPESTNEAINRMLEPVKDQFRRMAAKKATPDGLRDPNNTRPAGVGM